MPAHPDEAFRALCLRLADETDPHKVELLKQRLRLLLLMTSDEEKARIRELPGLIEAERDPEKIKVLAAELERLLIAERKWSRK